MGLLGCYSNPEIQERLRQLSDKLDRLVASDAAPRPSARRDRKLRGGIVPRPSSVSWPMLASRRGCVKSMPRSKGCSGCRCRPPRSRTGWLNRFRISSPELCGWAAGGIGWPNTLVVADAVVARNSQAARLTAGVWECFPSDIAGSQSPYRSSGAGSRPLGHTTVRASSSTRTCRT